MGRGIHFGVDSGGISVREVDREATKDAHRALGRVVAPSLSAPRAVWTIRYRSSSILSAVGESCGLQRCAPVRTYGVTLEDVEGSSDCRVSPERRVERYVGSEPAAVSGLSSPDPWVRTDSPAAPPV